ncbi:MAG TPA: AAA family ATPase [Thermomicrobiales bacterium]|nr:AAA family ATPase [Thermomicrobiales bacterium]
MRDAADLGAEPFPTTALVGRDRELAALRGWLAAALAGRGRLVLVGGDAGIGKTALAEALCAEAAVRGALALVGRCYDLSETPPYGPWLAALARYPAGDALPSLPDSLAEPGRLGPVAGRDALFGEVRDFLAAVTAARPLVLLLDDLHWADPASLDLLRVLARGLGDLPLLLLATYRSDELPDRHPLAALLPRLVREAGADRLALRPLDGAAVHALVAARYSLAEPELARLAAYLQARAEGNPFFLGELLRTLEEEAALRPAGGAWALGDLAAAPVPPLLRQVVAERAARLSDEAQRLLALAAVLGQEVPLDVWAGVGEVDEARLLDVVERAAEAHLVTPTPDGAGVRFAHALVREALYAGVLAPRRRAWHRRAAEALAAQPDPGPDAVAYHFRQAGDPRAATWLVRAGERAQRAHAWHSAAERFAAALALLDPGPAGARERGWAHFRLALLARYTDQARSVAALTAAGQLAGEGGDARLAAHVRFGQGLLACFAGRFRAGLAAMAAGIAALEAAPPPDAAERTRLEGVGVAGDPRHHRGTLALWLAYTGRYREAGALAAGVARRPPGEGPGTLEGAFAADAHWALAEVHLQRGRPAQARRAFARVQRAYRASDNATQRARAALNELYGVILQYYPEDLAARGRLLTEAEGAFARAGGMIAALAPGLLRLPLLYLEGRWAEIPAIADAARRQPGTARWLPLLAGGALGLLACERGDAATAWREVRDAFPAGPGTEPGDSMFSLAIIMQRLAVALALDAGDLSIARAWLEANGHWLAWAGAANGQADSARGWAAYYRAAGDLAAARRHAEAALARASAPRQPLALLAAHRLLGELAIAAGRHAEAAVHLSESLALADACAAPYERALTLLALAELRASEGQPAAARAPLDEARAILEPLQARPALARADALAARLRRPPSAIPARPADLSAREAEVLRLVAQGLTDVQVAGRLFLSPHTVGTHLRSIYNKLGVDNRTAAAAFARDHGLA